MNFKNFYILAQTVLFARTEISVQPNISLSSKHSDSSDSYLALFYFCAKMSSENEYPDSFEVEEIGIQWLDDEAEIILKPVLDESTQPAKKPRIRKTPAKSEYKWEVDEVTQLINFVEQYDCIWNTAAESYHNRTMRDAAWVDITAMFENPIPLEQVRKKWDTLRIQYKRIENKVTSQKSGSAAKSEVHWQNYEALQFISTGDSAHTTASTSNLDNAAQQVFQYTRVLKRNCSIFFISFSAGA